jgi:MATE family multidrug resistance protein
VSAEHGEGDRGRTLRALLRLAWPIVVSRSTQVVVGISDAVLVAHLGAAALAATTAGSLNAFNFFILPMGTVFIVSSFSSQLFGMGDLRGARRYAWYGLAIALASGVIGVASIPLIPRLLAPLPYAPDVRALMEEYLELRLLSAGPVIGIEALANYYGGVGRPRLPMKASVAAMVLNVAGCVILIDGRLGAPAMGVRGSALASTLASSAAFLGLLAVFLREGWQVGSGPLRLPELLRVLRFGLPSGVNWFLEFLAFTFFTNVVVAGLGTTSVAALMAVFQVNSVAFMPAFGVASAGAILVGQAIGARARERVPALVGLAFAVAAAWEALVAIPYLVAPDLVLAPFARDAATAAALVEVARRMLYLSVAWQLFDAGASVLAEALRAAGDTVFTLWARVAIAWLVFAPGSWISVRILGGGDVAAVAWLLAYLALLALTLWARFRSGAWRKIVLVEASPSPPGQPG